ncbi:hypothetical protein OAI34_06885 [Emcibacteraceae bacterium]|nr:hypothetical protein [Emcibacteraceae bacterium]MDC0082111.1 hypothetical protein [Emcibacteraceae bacterium]
MEISDEGYKAFGKAPPLADENLNFFKGLHNAMVRYGYIDVVYEF